MNPTQWDPQDESYDDGNRKQVTSIELAEKRGVTERGSLIPSLTSIIQEALRELGDQALLTYSASSTAVSAVEGRLPQKTGDDLLKEALIEQSFATAARERAQAEAITLETAWKQFQKTLATLQGMGIPVLFTTLPDGRPAVTVGDGLALPLPGFQPAARQTVPLDGGAVPPQ